MPRGKRNRRHTGKPAANPSGRRGTQQTVSIKYVDDLHTKNQETNSTDMFDSPNHIVIRRGNTFELLVEVSSLSDFKKESVTVEFHRGITARYSRGTMFQGACSIKSKLHYQWDMKAHNADSNNIRYVLDIPVNCPVGNYKVFVRLPVDKKLDSVWELKKEVVVLFNPWCKDDGVFVADEDKRQEYILNESGLIWAGTYRNMFTWPWNYAQFETVSLEAVLYMMDVWNLGSDARRNPMDVSRCMAEMVNSNDSDGGILIGLWSGNDKDYADGTAPTSWSGSEAILQQYINTKKPVKYAQCWVFGGTLTTVLRTLGIPSRPITNFESAHDANFNRAIDYYFDDSNNVISDKSDDSIWNYHVWCESWMTRPDLEGNNGGWQALDATPQELSPYTRTMVVGPASTQAIKDGLDMKYDNEFVIAEVNADIKYHYCNKAGKFIVMGSDTKTVGTHISTKAVGLNTREDITLHYKYREGSAAERAALKGNSGSGDDEHTKPFTFGSQLVSKSDLGSNLIFEVNVTTKETVEVLLKVTGIIEQATYTGLVGKEIKRETKTIKARMLPGSVQRLQFTVTDTEYEEFIGEQATLMGTFLAYSEKHDVSWISRIPISLSLPSLKIDIDKKGSEKVSLKGLKTVSATVSLTNPLKKPLTEIVYYIEGTGLLAAKHVSGSNLAIGKTGTITFTVTPRPHSSNHSMRNKVTLIVTAKSKQLKGLMGTATITIVP